jgi:hypothetical protein
MQLNYWNASWPLRVDICPCDVHFVEYLREAGVQNKVIFHFGTGAHHIVGKMNFEAAVPNEILAITASREEYDDYIDFIIANPLAAKTYKVIFGDIYTLTPRIIPTFDYVTLFHLCEFYDEGSFQYAGLDDSSLLDLFLAKLNRGGRVIFYKSSSHFARCQRIIDHFVDQARMIRVDEYKTLLVYARADERELIE